jgi:hypothetical protein
MTFWTSRHVTPKTKSKFIVKIDQYILKNVKSVTKPAVEINTKEFKLINHYFNYPGLAKWQPITIKFVDMKGDYASTTGAHPSTGLAGNQMPDTAHFLHSLLTVGGYSTPNSGDASMSKGGFAKGLKEITIQQISPGRGDVSPGGAKTVKVQDYEIVESWKLINPIIKSIKWGDLDYGSDDLVEYSIDVIYDYAEFKSGAPGSRTKAEAIKDAKAIQAQWAGTGMYSGPR